MMTFPPKSWLYSRLRIAGDGQFTIARYNNNGSLDTSFGTNGIVIPMAGSGQGVKVRSDGKIIIAGRNNIAEFALVRLNSNGTLDNSFDLDGIVTTPMGNGGFVSAWDIIIQVDEKIAVSGSSFNGNDYDMAVVRYNNDGSLDTSSDTDGHVIYDSGNGNDEGSAIDLQADGKILVGGYSNIGSSEAFTLLRLNTNGTFDTEFSGDGIVITADGTRGLGLTIQADNKIVMTGYHSGNYLTVRYENNSISSLDNFVYLPILQKPSNN